MNEMKEIKIMKEMKRMKKTMTDASVSLLHFVRNDTRR
jgi:hypothetical protein